MISLSLQDPTGHVNKRWKQFIPRYKDGTVSLIDSGFVSTHAGTSCNTCEYFKHGLCYKIHGFPPVKPGNCCNYWEHK